MAGDLHEDAFSDVLLSDVRGALGVRGVERARVPGDAPQVRCRCAERGLRDARGRSARERRPGAVTVGDGLTDEREQTMVRAT